MSTSEHHTNPIAQPFRQSGAYWVGNKFVSILYPTAQFQVMKKLLHISTTCFLLLMANSAQGTHLRAGEILVERLTCSELQYKITLILYTNTISPTHPGGTAGGGMLQWGSGSTQVPFIANVTIINAAFNIGRVTYSQVVSFPKEGTYTIRYEEAHRNVSTLNIPNGADNIDFYVENQLIVSTAFCDSSPSFLVPPIDQACHGMAFFHNPGASDPDGDSLSYSITIPKGNNGVSISGYEDPNRSKFYIGLNYQQANMDKNGPPTFGINATSGLLTWDAPGAIGSYNIAIQVTQWKKNPTDSSWFQFGYVVRDMQIEVLDCNNHPPDLVSIEDRCVLAGDLITVEVRGKDQDFDNVTMEVFSDITSFTESPASVTYATALQSTAADTAHIRITWRPDCIRVRQQPYQIVVKITDSPPNGGVKLTRFRSFNIKVMGPPPVLNQVEVNPVNKKVTLQWDLYSCQNAEAIQVWRRVAQRNYTQPPCETGMQKSLQYMLLTEIPGNSTRYEDHDLAIGAQYCYRIVARFRDVASKISLDTCFIPQPAKAPVITHVTINKTDEANGEIRISWTSPFELDPIQYPPPYYYEVQRGNGFEGNDWLTITTSTIADTTFLDQNLLTIDTAYHYRIFLFVPSVSTAVVDTSSIASSVKLESVATDQHIQLNWDARVPWSIFLEQYPYHYIYRSETDNENDFVLIDSVDVNENGLTYVDEGHYLNQKLDDHKIYFYKIETLGAYGNPKIKEPFNNFSQRVSDHILDTTPPCAPIVTVVKPDCKTLPCSETYSNTITWKNSTTTGCDHDVVYYEVYMADTPTGEFTRWIDHLEDSLVIQNNLKDMSVCYKIVAVDWVGNRSSSNDVYCGENCPVIYMPNVFTPGVTEMYNDTFRAFSATGNILNKECSRFIDYMSLMVINRWGEEVFFISSEDIDAVVWDGKDNGGKELATGVYYYTANVRLKYSSEKTEMKTLKNWVHLIR